MQHKPLSKANREYCDYMVCDSDHRLEILSSVQNTFCIFNTLQNYGKQKCYFLALYYEINVLYKQKIQV